MNHRAEAMCVSPHSSTGPPALGEGRERGRRRLPESIKTTDGVKEMIAQQQFNQSTFYAHHKVNPSQLLRTPQTLFTAGLVSREPFRVANRWNRSG